MHTVIVTGATSGIGLAVVRALLNREYRVIGIGHSEKNCNIARAELQKEYPGADIRYYWGDLMQQREVRRLAKALKQDITQRCGGKLYALINNAGCARSWYATTEEGYEQLFALNHLAGFLLTHYMLPYLKNGQGCVVMTGSNSHKHMKMRWDDVMFQKRYHPLLAYKQSKLCNLLFADALNRRFSVNGVRAYVVDPGLVKTDIGFKETGRLVRSVWAVRKKQGAKPDIPAKTYTFLCDAQPRENGLYYRFCKQAKYSRHVTEQNADKLFHLSEQLAGIEFGRETEV
ncbi:MAG: SDR family NAD(P)-dependent oxidoreductase [Bacillota bacterium]